MPQHFATSRPGHQVELLEGSRAFFPALIAAIDAAVRDVRLESYIFDFTGEAGEVALALVRAARRGVRVRVVADGFGTPPLSAEWQERFLEAGVEWRVYAPTGTVGVLWPGNWRRLHRKLCVVDAEVAFCGGINILDDLHDPNHGALEWPRFDFSVKVRGPLVLEALETMSRLWLRMQAVRDMKQARLSGALTSWRASGTARATNDDGIAEPAPTARAALVLRDNFRNRASIERTYRRAVGHAREEIIIANAYFVPGGKMRRALESAARRGVRVRLLLQGRYEYFMQYYAARPIYGSLLRAGIEIHEYSPSFLHAKVAVIDGRWATVGSSNLDPLSLLLAREANVVVEDEAFAGDLRARLLSAMKHEGRVMNPGDYAARPLRQRFMEHVALLVMRLLLAVQGKRYL